MKHLKYFKESLLFHNKEYYTESIIQIIEDRMLGISDTSKVEVFLSIDRKSIRQRKKGDIITNKFDILITSIWSKQIFPNGIYTPPFEFGEEMVLDIKSVILDLKDVGTTLNHIKVETSWDNKEFESFNQFDRYMMENSITVTGNEVYEVPFKVKKLILNFNLPFDIKNDEF